MDLKLWKERRCQSLHESQCHWGQYCKLDGEVCVLDPDFFTTVSQTPLTTTEDATILDPEFFSTVGVTPLTTTAETTILDEAASASTSQTSASITEGTGGPDRSDGLAFWNHWDLIFLLIGLIVVMATILLVRCRLRKNCPQAVQTEEEIELTTFEASV